MRTRPKVAKTYTTRPAGGNDEAHHESRPESHHESPSRAPCTVAWDDGSPYVKVAAGPPGEGDGGAMVERGG